ncbi:MAG: UvrB/UvrC motif-containing protein [Patescibacteria group bacterium]|nr:UvrB/UvrC motif-containing protein [Patescibacteria group bacterium]
MENNIQKQLKTLPDKSGVYLFYNHGGELVYVGKATSLKSRVKSYFSGLRSPRPVELMIHNVAKIKFFVTGSALEAIILEGNLIKKYWPKYNVLGKDDKSWNYIVITKDKCPRVATVREQELKLMGENKAKEAYCDIFGPYPGLNAKAAMKILRRMFKISYCRPGAKRACIYREMGECLGVCTGEISPADYKRKVIRPLKMFLSGAKEKLIKKVVREMVAAAKAENFEEAGRLRDQLRALKRIHDIALINKSWVEDSASKKTKMRIEGYDISNLGASNKVGSMAVFDADGPVKSQYRKFNIFTVPGQGDVDCLAEVLSRRLKHKDWLMPDVILVDGGRPQVNRAKRILYERGLNIPLVGIAKGPKRAKNEFLIVTKNPAMYGWISSNKNLLIRLRDEAHRFAVSFHRKKMASLRPV